VRRRLEAQLENWRARTTGRLPLLLNGARQVGKTHLLREYGATHFVNTAYVNFETNPHAAAYFDDDIAPETVIRYLETETGQPIVAGQTLIVLDEIQSAPRALTSLKYFAESAPQFHVAAAGSLLGVAIHREEQSYPVGNVTSLTLRPLDFEEFLWGMGEDRLADDIRTAYTDRSALPEALHRRALDSYRRYLVVGGMPRAVSAVATSGSLLGVAEIHQDIINDYAADMAKYATAAEAVKIRAAYASLPAQLAKDNRKFQYKLAARGGTATVFGAAIDWLVFAGVVNRCERVDPPVMPLAAYRDLAAFKLYMGDTGLLVSASAFPANLLLSGSSDASFMGAIAENYVAQSLAANGIPLYYWTSDNRAEVDFVVQLGDDIVPVEVKAGTNTRSRSLSVFAGRYDPPYVVRVSAKPLGWDPPVKSVPLYAVHCLQASRPTAPSGQ